jgi:hypothetical protein
MGAQKGWNAPQRFMKRVGGMLGLAGQGMMDSAVTFATGVDPSKQRTVATGQSAMGKEDDTGKKQTFGTASKGANVYTKEMYKNSPDKRKKSPDTTNTAGNTNNDQPEDTKPTYDNQRDTNAT